MEFLTYLVIGAFSGFFAGLLGIGGGLISVPALLVVLPLFQIPSEQVMHIAVATSLFAIVPTAVISAYSHYKLDAIYWPAIKKLVPGLLIGGMMGAAFAASIPKAQLQLIFAVFLLLVSLYMFKSAQIISQLKRKKNGIQSFVGVLIGSLSSAMGVGGGTMTVPYLVWRGVEIHRAVGTSAFCGLPIAFAGTIIFLFLQWQGSNSEEVLYVYFPAFFSLVCGSILFAPIGAKVAHSLPVKKLKTGFAILLLIIGLKMILA